MIIPIFLPQIGCPNHCIYCNQEDLTGTRGLPRKETIDQTVQAYLASSNQRQKADQTVEIAFYGGTFTALPEATQAKLLDYASSWIEKRLVHHLRISTRPDYVDLSTVRRLSTYGVAIVEIGAQTMNPKVLQNIYRFHKPQATVRAIKLLKQEGITTGLHLMTALPGEDEASALLSLEESLHLKPDFLRIHPTLVLKNSLLEKKWRTGAYQPWSWGRNLRLLTKMALLCARHKIPVYRWGLMPGELCRNSYLAGPYAPALGEWVKRSLAFHYVASLLTIALSSKEPGLSQLTLSVPQKDLSLVKGQGSWLLRHCNSLSDIIITSSTHQKEERSLNLPNYLPFHGDWHIQKNGEKLFFLTQEEFIANWRI
ncbi:radical SAM protein [Heliorestis acidaminivorans]|uniref:Radical SAM protein n=1 Tax=Heliorestis acidaminivorans TaxID=553427 RepID=A0A6I0F361_9FIRM|nr:radical SAM protein [Heliorestis acidaminivorans]KAB2954441.1 radical SAM protein [Heliorestis acidaminivorans]